MLCRAIKRSIEVYVSLESTSQALANLRGARGTPPGPYSFNFMQFWGKFGKIVCWHPPHPPPKWGWRPHLGEILYPLMLRPVRMVRQRL